ncbi:site-specific integrase [Rhizobium anhuiense]|uniref:site-specific integrase n=1 Tax=Rhizobium anhuiense TaxID=1184720 RepID=UPI0015CF0B6A|nr:site-specific integrase [Rhizobium anhuiense]
MAKPTTRKGTANAQFKRRVPLHLVDKLKGQRFAADLPTDLTPFSETIRVSCVIHDHVKFSLRTADPRLVQIRDDAASTAYATFLHAAERGPADLTHRELTALQGLAYCQLIAQHQDEPPQIIGEGRQTWTEFELWTDILDEASQWIDHGKHLKARDMLSRLLDIDALLSARAIILSDKSYRDFIEGLIDTIAKAMHRLQANARGDYSPDRTAALFPVWSPETARALHASEIPSAAITLEDLFNRWKAETKPAASTISTWQGFTKQFAAFLGKIPTTLDPRAVTEADALNWKADLLDKGYQRIRVGHLACLKRLYRYGIENSATTGVTSSPFENVKVNQKQAAGTGRLPFSNADVKLILSAARKEKLAYLRWVPWLCANTGARVGEIVQLWGSRIVEEDGIPCMRITAAPDGGAIKNEGSERTVPIHPALIADGFLTFVKSMGTGPLFYKEVSHKAAKARGDDASRHKSKGTANRVAEWVRKIGITDPRKAPSHSWRHWQKTALGRQGISDRLIDSIHGHADKSAAASYFHPTPADMLVALNTLDLAALAISAPAAEPRAIS